MCVWYNLAQAVWCNPLAKCKLASIKLRAVHACLEFFMWTRLHKYYHAIFKPYAARCVKIVLGCVRKWWKWKMLCSSQLMQPSMPKVRYELCHCIFGRLRWCFSGILKSEAKSLGEKSYIFFAHAPLDTLEIACRCSLTSVLPVCVTSSTCCIVVNGRPWRNTSNKQVPIILKQVDMCNMYCFVGNGIK